MDRYMVTKKLVILFTMLCFYVNGYCYQQNDTITFKHSEITFESSFLKNNNSYSASYSYLLKLNKRLELGPQLYLATYDIDNLGRFYPLSLRGHIKFYFGDLLKMEANWINQLYATSKLGLAYELKDKNFINSDQYICGFGTTIKRLSNKRTVNFEIGGTEVALNRNNTKFFKNLITFGLNYKL